MNLLYWNCQGLGNQQTVQELGDLVWAQDLAVEFLAETWLDKARLVSICDSLQFGHHHGVQKLLVVVVCRSFGRRTLIYTLNLLL